MKMRLVFLSDARQAHVPKGWRLGRIDVIEKKKGKPQYMCMLTREDDFEEGKSTIGFNTRAR